MWKVISCLTSSNTAHPTMFNSFHHPCLWNGAATGYSTWLDAPNNVPGKNIKCHELMVVMCLRVEAQNLQSIRGF